MGVLGWLAIALAVWIAMNLGSSCCSSFGATLRSANRTSRALGQAAGRVMCVSWGCCFFSLILRFLVSHHERFVGL